MQTPPPSPLSLAQPHLTLEKPVVHLPRPRLVVVPALVSALLLGATAAPTRAQRTMLDDFASRTDAQWTHLDLLAQFNLGPTIYDASSGRYRIASSLPLPALPFPVFSAAQYTDSLTRQAHYANGVYELMFRFDNAATNILLAVRFDQSLSGYIFNADNNQNAIGLGRVDRGATVPGGGASVPFAFAEHTNYVMRATLFGPVLTVRVWPAGKAASYAEVSLTDSTHGSGWTSLIIYSAPPPSSGQLSAQFDNLHFTPYAEPVVYGLGCAGAFGPAPTLGFSGKPTLGGQVRFEVTGATPRSFGVMLIGLHSGSAPIGLCTALVSPPFLPLLFATNGAGEGRVPVPLFSTTSFATQALVLESSPQLLAATAGIDLLFH